MCNLKINNLLGLIIVCCTTFAQEKITPNNIAAFVKKKPALLPTPPMGWNSWNKFACEVNENLIKEMADAIVDKGLKDLGYTYINVDDCWQIARDKDGFIVVDSIKFPSGMKALGDYIHSKGLKFGLYSCAGIKTCQGRPGGNGYEKKDASSYAAWGVDYLKYDWCNTEGIDAYKAYTDMANALNTSGRDIVFSLCEWGANKPWLWAAHTGHLWRTTGDIKDCWDCHDGCCTGWVNILDKQNGLEKYAGPGHWNDPDMLEVGNGGMTNNEYISHFSFWCLLAAPLICGNDIRTMNDSTAKILTNKDAIAVNQDKAGIQGKKVYDNGDTEIWSRPLGNGDKAIIFFNRASKTTKVQASWQKLGITSTMKVFDIWKHQSIGNTANVKSFTIKGHSVVFVRVSKK